MVKISTREFAHHLSKYIQRAERGEKILITKRNRPSVQLSYYNEQMTEPNWKTPFEPVKIKGEPLSKTIIKMRRER